MGDGIVVDFSRHNRGISGFNPEARMVRVEAGVVLSRLHEAADQHDLNFPLWFGARGSARDSSLARAAREAAGCPERLPAVTT